MQSQAITISLSTLCSSRTPEYQTTDKMVNCVNYDTIKEIHNSNSIL